jgi:DNA-binding transcriptional MerR regulator
MSMPPPLDRYRAAEHGLSSLVQAARSLLEGAPRGTADDRVTAWPDERTVRYYQSLGLVDRPLRHDGREVVYGYRHLLQAVAVKLLQAEGYSLAQAQRSLAGRSTASLEEAVAQALGVAVLTPTGLPPAPPPDAPPSGPPGAGTPIPRVADASTRTLLTREVAPGVLVTIDPALVPDPDAIVARIARALSYPPSGGSP